jgi:2-dehydro-3-deoxyphosphogluconate aldolase/(4S)-4-hydroxy-2-oxoglutarate aldolase
MSKRSELLKLIPDQGIVPLYYTNDTDTSIELMKALYRAGIMTTEYADRGEEALKNFKEMRKICDSELPGMYLGIGTIKNAVRAQAYIDAGAEFIVCPGVMEDVSAMADDNDLCCIPGCMTPSEIIRAEATGTTIVKLFPANTLGPAYLDAVRSLFKGIQFIPTGGIELNEDNLRYWFKSQICAVGGSKLITKDVIDSKKYDELTANAKSALQLIRSVRDSLGQ